MSVRRAGQTLRLRECSREGCTNRYDDLWWSNPWPKAFCSQECARGAATRSSIQTPRKPISVASKEQRAKRVASASIVSGATEGLDAAHLAPRGLGGCDDPLCVVPLTRAEHRAFDMGELDLLPYLVAHRCFDEMAHALVHFRGDLPALLERLTGVPWYPSDIGRAA